MFRRKVKPSERPAPAFNDESNLGNILMRMKALTKEQLLTAIGRKAQHDDMLLGALLKELGFVNDEQVAKALTIQAKLRKGDAGTAAMMVMEARLEAFGQGEDQLRDAIDGAKQQSRDRGEGTGVWLIPMSGTVKV